MNQLHGKRILLTRTAEQNIATAALVSQLGATPILFPCLNITYLTQSIKHGLTKLGEADKDTTDIIFSSSNGVAALASCVESLSQTLAGFRIVAIGTKTAASLSDFGCSAHLIPEDASQLGLIQAYKKQTLPKQAFFFRAEDGSDALPDFFKTQGVDLTLTPSYQSSCVLDDASQVIQLLQENSVDAVLLGSARTACFYVQRIDDISLANKPAIAVMSPQVAEAADKLGLDVQIIAGNPSFKAMLDGLDQYFAKK